MPDARASRIEVRLASDERGAVAHLTVHNEAKLNTLDRALMDEFVAAVEALASRDDLRALVLSGGGEKAFIGGANIPEMAALDRTSAEGYIRLVHRTCDCLRQLPVPVVARIDGYALGAGLEVAVSCDLRVASTRARFGMPEVKVGIPSVVEAALIPGLIGFGRARELLMLGEIIDAETALRWGLVERVVAPDALDREVEKIVAALLTAGPQAVRIQKQLMRDWESLPIDRAIAAGIDAFVRAFDTDEPRRLLSAFASRKRGSPSPGGGGSTPERTK
jgi:enoyl-CoA hydratase